MSKLSELVKRRREKKGLSQRQLAIKIGCSNTDISQVEKGIVRSHSKEFFYKLADALGVSVIEVLKSAGYIPEDACLIERSRNTAAGEFAEALAIEWPGIVDMMSAMLRMSDEGVMSIIKYAAYVSHMERIEMEDEQDDGDSKKEQEYGAGGDGL